MRSAEVNNVWRKHGQRPFAKWIVRATVDNFRGLHGVSIKLGSGITALCGPNGAGKTSLLRALQLPLDPGTKFQDAVKIEAASAQVTLELSVDRKQHTALWPHTTTPCNLVEVIWIDAGSFASVLRQRIQEFGGVDDQLAGLEPKEASAADLDELQYVVGRRYSAVKIYEVDLGQEEPTPYFVCTSNGVSYGLEQMGQGELSAHLLLWALQHAQPRALVLLEEPETFLAPRAQAALLNVLAQVSNRRELSIVLSTHSEAILRRLPIERVRLVTRSVNGVQVEMVTSRSVYLSTLGVPVAPRSVVLVEDEVALVVARELVALCHFDALSELAFEVVRDGESGICEILKRWPNGAQRVVGLFDGDQRETMRNRPLGDSLCGYTFLPGIDPPEILLQRIVEAHPDAVANRLTIPHDRVRRALAIVEGMDLHDWIHDLRRALSVSIDLLVRAILSVMYDDEQGRVSIDASVTQLLSLVNNP